MSASPAERTLSRPELAVILALAGLAWAVSSAGYTCEAFDDAYILFRYADHWAAGLGPVFNEGEPVEGFSCPLFLALLAALRRAGVPAPAAAGAVNLAAFAGCLVVVATWAAELRVRCRPAPFVAAGLVAVHPSVLQFLHSGMETVSFAFLVLLTLFLLRRPVATAGRAGAVALAAVAVTATRPEGLLILAGAGAVVLFDVRFDVASNRFRSPVLTFLAVSLALVAGLLATRHAYFGDWLPNTYYAKAPGLSLKRLARGVEYVLGDPAAFLVAPLVLTGLVPGTGPRRSRTSILVLLAIGTMALFALWAGGDWMAGHRFLVPALAPAAVLWGLSCELVVPLLRRPRAVGAVVGLLLLTGAWAARTGLAVRRDLRRIWSSNVPFTRAHAALGRWIDRNTAPDVLVAIGAVGAIGYTDRRRTLDCWGLTDAYVARHGKKVPAMAAGHQSYDGDYVWRRRPHLVFLWNDFSDRRLSEDEYLARALADRELSSYWARELVGRPGFREAYFFRNLEVADGTWFAGYFRREIVDHPDLVP